MALDIESFLTMSTRAFYFSDCLDVNCRNSVDTSSSLPFFWLIRSWLSSIYSVSTPQSGQWQTLVPYGLRSCQRRLFPRFLSKGLTSVARLHRFLILAYSLLVALCRDINFLFEGLEVERFPYNQTYCALKVALLKTRPSFTPRLRDGTQSLYDIEDGDSRAMYLDDVKLDMERFARNFYLTRRWHITRIYLVSYFSENRSQNRLSSYRLKLIQDSQSTWLSIVEACVTNVEAIILDAIFTLIELHFGRWNELHALVRFVND